MRQTYVSRSVADLFWSNLVGCPRAEVPAEVPRMRVATSGAFTRGSASFTHSQTYEQHHLSVSNLSSSFSSISNPHQALPYDLASNLHSQLHSATVISVVMSKFKVFFGGHSFVVSLHDHLQHRFHTCKTPIDWMSFVTDELKVSSFVDEVYFHGIRGGRIMQNYFYPAHTFGQKQFSVGILDIGSNDAVLANTSIDDIVFHTMAEAEAMRDLFKIPVVKICSIINRDNAGELSPQDFMGKAATINGELKAECATRPGIFYHGHEGFWRDAGGRKTDANAYSYDGVHPNSPEGRRKYKASITKAIHGAWRELRALDAQ